MPPTDAPTRERSSVDALDAVRLGALASAFGLLGLALLLALLPRAASGTSPACPSPLVQTAAQVLVDGGGMPPACEPARRASMLALVVVLAGPLPAAGLLNLWALVRRPAAATAVVGPGGGEPAAVVSASRST